MKNEQDAPKRDGGLDDRNVPPEKPLTAMAKKAAAAALTFAATAVVAIGVRKFRERRRNARS